MIFLPYYVNCLSSWGQALWLGIDAGWRSSKSIAMYCCTVWHYCSAIFVLKTLFFKYLYCKNSKINLLFTFKIIIGEIQQMRKIVTKPSSLFMWRDFYTTRKAIENVYIHLPFCQKKCHFCAFPIHAIGIN